MQVCSSYRTDNSQGRGGQRMVCTFILILGKPGDYRCSTACCCDCMEQTVRGNDHLLPPPRHPSNDCGWVSLLFNATNNNQARQGQRDVRASRQGVDKGVSLQVLSATSGPLVMSRSRGAVVELLGRGASVCSSICGPRGVEQPLVL